MTRAFHLAADLGPTAAAKQLALVAPALPRDEFDQAVGVLGDSEPFADPLTAGGIEVVRLPLRHTIDVNGLIAVARAVSSFRPDVLHAWGSIATRVAYLLRKFALRPSPVFVASGCDAPGPGPTGWLTRRALRAARAVTAATPAAADRLFRATGVAPTLIPPAVVVPSGPPDPTDLHPSLGVPPGARLIVAAGGFDRASDLRTATWAFDVLKYTDPNLYLVLLGDGPDRDRIGRFTRPDGWDDLRMRFAGTRADVPAVLNAAEVVWVTHLRGGVNLTLEALAAGVPVVAAANPELAGVIEDGATGRLFPPGDRVKLAALTGDLLDDPAGRSGFAAAGRAVAETRFAAGPVVERYARLYHDVIPAGRQTGPCSPNSPSEDGCRGTC